MVMKASPQVRQVVFAMKSLDPYLGGGGYCVFCVEPSDKPHHATCGWHIADAMSKDIAEEDIAETKPQTRISDAQWATGKYSRWECEHSHRVVVTGCTSIAGVIFFSEVVVQDRDRSTPYLLSVREARQR